MSIQLYEAERKDEGHAAENSGAIVTLPNGLQITEEEHEKRIKDVSPCTDLISICSYTY